MDYKTLAETIASSNYTLSASDVLALTNALLPLFPVEDKPKYDVSNKESLGAYALTVPNVVLYARENKKIAAIKELRIASQCGLKEAKDAVESNVFTNIFPQFFVSPNSDWN
jgi:ribosomal protein L7/L12